MFPLPRPHHRPRFHRVLMVFGCILVLWANLLLIYETNLFVVTKNVNSVTNKRQVKCVSCIHRGSLSSANDWDSGKYIDGTSTLIYHAQHERSDDSLVSSILSQIQSQKNAVIPEKKQKMINCKMYGF